LLYVLAMSGDDDLLGSASVWVRLLERSIDRAVAIIFILT
jgi:hypothetical protein